MSSIGIGVGALCGALAGLIAWMVSSGSENRGKFGGIFAVAFVVLYGLARMTFLPGMEARHEARKLESTLAEVPAFRAIKQHDPTTYNSIVANFKKAVESGADRNEIIAKARAEITMLVMKRVPTASDESVSSYMKVMMTELDELSNQ